MIPIPAYEGDAAERSSIIAYAFDLDGVTDVEYTQYEVLTSLLNEVGSPLYDVVMERGIENPVAVGVIGETQKPSLTFVMYYADPDQKDDFKSLVEEVLARTASEGVDPAIADMILKREERGSRLIRNESRVGTQLLQYTMIQWARSGDPNFYRPYEQALKALHADSGQLTIRKMALDLLTPRRSALVCSVPTPGLAEQHDRELKQYLDDMKASMSREELEAMAAELAARYRGAVDKAFTRDNLIFMAAVPESEGDDIVARAAEALSALPEKSGADADYALPEFPESLPICVESSVNDSCLAGDYMEDEAFEGRYLPFYYALNDAYTLPTFRFRLGAYGGKNEHEWMQGCLYTLVYSDPNVRKTIDALRAMPAALGELSLTQEQLDGSILKAYGNVTKPNGVLNDAMAAMENDLLGADAARVLAIQSDIRNAKLEDQEEAVEHIGAILENSTLVTVGNEALIRADADCFDEVISWRSAD